MSAPKKRTRKTATPRWSEVIDDALGNTLREPPPNSRNLKDIAAEMGCCRRTAAERMQRLVEKGTVSRHNVMTSAGIVIFFTIND